MQVLQARWFIAPRSDDAATATGRPSRVAGRVLERSMPQQNLQGAKVGAHLQQVRRERVTQEMGIDAEREARARDSPA